jgi:hypothetical protein
VSRIAMPGTDRGWRATPYRRHESMPLRSTGALRGILSFSYAVAACREGLRHLATTTKWRGDHSWDRAVSRINGSMKPPRRLPTEGSAELLAKCIGIEHF